MTNVFTDIPETLPQEIFQDIITTGLVRIERILSQGHVSPENGWYDQVEHEWVIVLKGKGIIEFEDGRQVALAQGDYFNIQAHEKHRVIYTSDSETTIWLAVFYQ
ncbi:cupin domain-containing protein [Vibrio viridaestus]|uniref:Cupin domain-containing protein n=1 Tax=Vibrio viridaestus TaxID=2487322 RepID=A0A3N9TK57_9VIBR|nr:cupin domain-containing protein [Vibrio viridaestus]RQW64354.1 cupin domain-containing protein [Vibrio viridaestus]